jgi:DNA topoisomerase-1
LTALRVHPSASEKTRHGNGAVAARAETPAADSARAAGLRYVNDDLPGISRRKTAKGFSYTAPDGKTVRHPAVLARIKSLVIPPAWRDVWICPAENGHLQATGRDARGRKQHRYHPRWREIRDADKYDKMLEFAKQLPSIRRKVDADLGLPGLPREKILATVVRLLEISRMRIGNEEYARDNKSFGLATLRNRHVSVSGSNIRFEFRGKSGVRHAVDLQDRRLARIIKQCQELPGQELFQYIAGDGARASIGSAEVNEYLRGITGADFSSKDFRTWSGTVLAATALAACESAQNSAQAKKAIAQAIESVAKKLGNTKAVCRKCYVHPAVLDAYADGSMARWSGRRGKSNRKSTAGLTQEEAAVVALLVRAAQPAHKSKRSELAQQLRKSLKQARAA